MKNSGFIIDLPKEQIVTDLALASELRKKFEPYNVWLALDNFGRACRALAKVEELPFEELKLDPSLSPTAVPTNSMHHYAKTVIDLAHNFGRYAVARGHRKGCRCLGFGRRGLGFRPGLLTRTAYAEERLFLCCASAATQGRNLDAASGKARKTAAGTTNLKIQCQLNGYRRRGLKEKCRRIRWRTVRWGGLTNT